MHPRTWRRGSLATLLVLSTLILMAGLTMASSSIFGLSTMTREHNAEIAHDLAESALQQALAHIILDPTLGEGAADDIVVTHSDLPPGSEGRVTFTHRDQPWSFNNRRESNPVTGWSNRSIPGKAAYFVAVGRAGGVVSTVEMMVHVPKFPLVLGTEGGVRLSRTLVGAVRDPADVTVDANGRLVYDERNLDRGDLVSNGRVQLSSQSTVTGSLQALQGYDCPIDCSIRGEVIAPCSHTDVPTIDVQRYDPRDDPHTFYDDRVAPQPLGTVLSGVVRYAGDVHVVGDVALQQGVLYVAGDLTLDNGGLHGSGAVFVTGDVHLGGGNRLAGSDQVTLLSAGNVEIEGDSSQASVFQGTVYARGKFHATHMNLIGSFLSASTASDATEFTDCTALYSVPLASVNMNRSVDIPLARFGPRAYQMQPPTLGDKGHLVASPLGPVRIARAGGADRPTSGQQETVQQILGVGANASDGYRLASDWQPDDPCVLHMEYDPDMPVPPGPAAATDLPPRWRASLTSWGRLAGTDHQPQPAPGLQPLLGGSDFAGPYYTSHIQSAVDFLGSDCDPPSPSEALANLAAVARQVADLADREEFKLAVGPNELIQDAGDKFRILYQRDL